MRAILAQRSPYHMEVDDEGLPGGEEDEEEEEEAQTPAALGQSGDGPRMICRHHGESRRHMEHNKVRTVCTQWVATLSAMSDNCVLQPKTQTSQKG